MLVALHGTAAAGDPIWIEEGPDGQDTSVYAAFPALVRGDYPTLYAFTAEDSGVDHSFRTFLRFDPSQEIAPGECIARAELSLVYAIEGVQPGVGVPVTEPGELECRPVLAGWDEMSMNWTNQPPVASAVDVVTGIDALGEYRCDVTSLVQGWVDGSLANYGVALFSSTRRGLGFYSFEATQPPDLKSAIAVELADPLACPEPAAGAAALALACLASLAARRHR